MNISNYYWYFTSAIPPKICDDIIDMAYQNQNLWLEQVVMEIEN